MTERKVEKTVTKKVAADSLQRALMSQPRNIRLTQGQRATFSTARKAGKTR
jgi:hypothetical protein